MNGNEKLSISEEKKGGDQHLVVAQQNFGRGVFIVKYTEYQNNTAIAEYQNFLAANATTTTDTRVKMFEEGDYEIVHSQVTHRKPWHTSPRG